MGRLKSTIVLGAVAIMGLCTIESSQGQDQQKTSPPSAQTAKELKKKEWLRQRKVKRATDAALKAHMKHQTKAVRKRMKKDAKKAKKNNKEKAS